MSQTVYAADSFVCKDGVLVPCFDYYNNNSPTVDGARFVIWNPQRNHAQGDVCHASQLSSSSSSSSSSQGVKYSFAELKAAREAFPDATGVAINATINVSMNNVHAAPRSSSNS